MSLIHFGHLKTQSYRESLLVKISLKKRNLLLNEIDKFQVGSLLEKLI
jgi:hypothetical protein